MNIILDCILLGLTAIVAQAARHKESPQVKISVWPPGSTMYLGETVALLCTVSGSARLLWTYHWYRDKPFSAAIPNPRHLVSGGSYSITGVSREDEGSYWCQVEGKGSNLTRLQLIDRARLTVSDVCPPLLTVSPSSRQLFRGRRLSVRCPASDRNSPGWILRQLSQDFGVRTTDFKIGLCSPLEGAVSKEISEGCVFPSTYSGNSGLYWCERQERQEARTNAVNITVSYGDMILMSPAHTVSEGEHLVLYCEYWNGTGRNTTLIKDGVEILTHGYGNGENIVGMSIGNATSADEGFYKCASPDRKMESPESWLSVRSNSTSLDETTVPIDRNGKWIALPCCIVGLLFLPLTIWLLHRYRYRCWSSQTCCPPSSDGLPHVDHPKTKQDVTEVQWDLPWMEMSNLLDQQANTGS